ALIPAVSAMLAMLAAWKPFSMKRCWAASRIRLRWMRARSPALLVCSALMASALLPPAAQRLVQGDAVGLFRQPRGHDGLLRRVQRALRVEQYQEAVQTGFVAGFRQAMRAFGGRQQGLLGVELLGQRARQREGIGHFPETGLDGALVVGQRDVAVDLGHPQCRAQAPTLEDRQVDARDEAPAHGAAVEQARELAA